MMIPLALSFCLAWCLFASTNCSFGHSKSDKLSSVPSPTELSLPLPQQHHSRCFTDSQAKYGPTVSSQGQGVNYGPSENVSHARGPPTNPTDAIWGKPTVRLANGSHCCDKISDARDYIDYIDETILKYFAIRQQFVVEAGRFKDSKEGVRAIPRAVGVVKHAESVAGQVGLAPWIANVSYTATLNSFVELELCLFDEDVRTKNYAPGS